MGGKMFNTTAVLSKVEVANLIKSGRGVYIRIGTWPDGTPAFIELKMADG